MTGCGDNAAAALRTSSAPAVSGSMRLQRMSVWPPFVVHVKPMGVRLMDFEARRVATLVLITEPGHVAHIDSAILTPGRGNVSII